MSQYFYTLVFCHVLLLVSRELSLSLLANESHWKSMHYMHHCYLIWCSFQCWGLRESPQTQEGLFRRARVLFWCLWIVTRSLIFYQTAPRLHRSTSLCWETGKKDLFPLKWLQVNSMLCNGALWFSVIKWVTWERKNLFQQLQHESCRTIRLSSEDHLSSICYRANAISWFLFSWFRFSFGDAVSRV